MAITQKFTALEPDKQERILNAALEEFAAQGYKKASTNRIVKKAGVGKGALFYYFKSKQELFYYLIEKGLDFIISQYLNQIDEKETDFLEKYRKAAQCKLKAYTKNPHVFNFFGSLYINQEFNLPRELEEKINHVRKLAHNKLFYNLDTSLFREDVPSEQIIKLIKWTMDGYEKDIINRLQGSNLSYEHLEPYWEEFFEYIAILKRIYYHNKGEETNGGTAGD